VPRAAPLSRLPGPRPPAPWRRPAPATRAAGTTDHVGPARPEFLYLDVEAMGVGLPSLARLLPRDERERTESMVDAGRRFARGGPRALCPGVPGWSSSCSPELAAIPQLGSSSSASWRLPLILGSMAINPLRKGPLPSSLSLRPPRINMVRPLSLSAAAKAAATSLRLERATLGYFT
jgi:hypothetical protein